MTFYRAIILTILFAVLVVTEFGGGKAISYTSSFQIQNLMSDLFDNNAIFDNEETPRREISSLEQLQEYFRLGMIPLLYNEPFKRARLTPYLRAYL